MIGVVSFAAASLLCGLAQSSTELVAARLVQGLTGAAMVPQVLALITATFPVPERSRALAWFGVLGLTVRWERRLARRRGEPLLDLPLFRDRTFSAGLAVNFGLVFFFGSFMFVLTLLLQAGLGQPPLHAGIEALPLAAAFTVMSILSPRFPARLGPRAITLGASLTTLGTVALALTGAHYGAQLTGWDLAPATMLIGLGQGISLPLLIGAVLAHVRPERAGAAAGILTTTQQFGAASGIAVIGAIFYGVLGATPATGTFVSGMVVAMSVNAALVAAAAAVTMLLPRRAAARSAVTV
jgi:MFS family permease